MRLAVLLVLAWLGTADATILFASGGDDPDEASGTATDSFAFVEGGTGADSTAKVVLSGYRHRSANGGGNESLGALDFSPGSGVSRYYEATGWTLSQATLGFSVSAQTAPSVARAIAEIRMGASRGCFARLNTDRTVSVYYATTGTAFGTTTATLARDACSGDPLRGCTANSDCVTPQTCTACNTTTGAGCYWPGLELTQTNFPSVVGDTVTCDLRRDGSVVLSSTPTAATGLSTITGFRVGGIDTEASALDLDVDDVVFDDTSRSGFGYVAPLYPTGTGQTQVWTINACGGGATGFQCVDDWTAGALYDSTTLNDTIFTSSANRTAEFWPFSTFTAASGVSVSAVHAVVVGRTTSGGSARVLGTAALSCTSLTSCAATTEKTVTLPDSVTHQVLQRATFTTTPSGGPWSGAELGKLGLRVRRISGSEAARVGAVVAYAVARRPDEQPPSNLKDHNLGTNDGKIAAYFVGDSLAGGTCASTCQAPATNAGAVCSQSTYCSWSATLDQPTGGCSTNAQCQTCSLRKTDANGGAGFPCTGDAECGSTGICSGGGCSQNDGITCDDDTDCRGLGTCDIAATCVEACPGGSCPGRTGWPFYTVGRIGADTVIACAQGGESSSTMVANRADGILAGTHSTCLALLGSGQCQCSTGADCGAGGACTGGLCTAGDTAHTACTESTTCASTKLCAFPPPDYVGVLEGVNDVAQNTAPTCAEPVAASSPALNTPGSPCNSGCGATILCSSNSDCSANGPSSTCVGATSDAQRMCLDAVQVASSGTNASCGGGTITSTTVTCSASIRGCNLSSECPNGQTCSTTFNTPVTGFRVLGTIDPLATLWAKHGFCQCANDGQCSNGFKCLGSRCRRPCSTDGQCSAPTVSGACNTGAGACKGTCTCPCDRATCTTSADCPIVDVALPGGLVDRYQGECVTGRCTNCGPQPCPFEAATKHAYHNTTRRPGGKQMTVALHGLETKIAAGTDADGRPTLLVLTHPEYNWVHPCASAWADSGYLAKVSRRARSEFPHVVDVRRVLAKLQTTAGYYSDFFVHFSAIGASYVGGVLSSYMGTFNRCVQWDQVDPTAQKYCQTPTGAWQSGDVPCTTAASCTAGNLCMARACTSNSDCPQATDACHTE